MTTLDHKVKKAPLQFQDLVVHHKSQADLRSLDLHKDHQLKIPLLLFLLQVQALLRKDQVGECRLFPLQVPPLVHPRKLGYRRRLHPPGSFQAGNPQLIVKHQ